MITTLHRLHERAAVVTGAGSGIGRAIALAFAAEGARVLCADINAAAARQTAQAIRAAGGQALARQVDVSRRTAVERMVSTALAAWGRVHILVAAAGIGPSAPFLDLAEAEWDRVLEVNLKGLFLCGQAVGRHMAEAGGGVIINVTSQLSEVAQAGSAHYMASKGGAKLLTKAMAIELAAYGIRVNALAPGLTNTAMTRLDTPDGRASRAKLFDHIPMGRAAEPDEIAQAAVFLASDEASYVTGASLFVDGGYLAL
jgi:NAD(P)-dependent dehydrogenase (short-subunit alcohol dehydrogenase family)